jgi:hypothetical protein
MMTCTQFVILRSIGLLLSAPETSWHPAPGQIQPQKKRRKKNPERKIETMTTTLRFITPARRPRLGVDKPKDDRLNDHGDHPGDFRLFALKID